MARLPLSLALNQYDHTADLVSGRVPVDGIELNCLTLPIEEIFFRTFVYGEFDISEVSMAKYCSRISQDDRSLVAIPVFPSRVPRHSSIYIRRDGPVRQPSDLAGRKVGLPEWAQTASVYSRGLLAHHYGVDLASIEWVQAGVNQPGRIEKVKLNLPPGVKVTPRPDKSLSEMLVSGEIDVALSAHAPDCFEQGHPNIGRLFENFIDVEMKYVKETGIFPIMHTVAIRGELLERHPWVAMNLFKAFEEAKNRSLARAQSITATACPIPWCYEQTRRAKEIFGEDFWPYGIEANRKTLDAFLQYAFEQGVCHRRLAPEDLFAKQVQERFSI
ncbi:MAG: 4,5-dihydroxyphthalate decarboxylase [Xanthobacteraceae bacterium]